MCACAKEDQEIYKLVTDNAPYVHYIVERNFPMYAYDDDVIQSGMIGLYKAARAYDESKSKFSTFAYRVIINEIKMYFRSTDSYKQYKNHVVSLPINASVPFDKGEGEYTLEDCIVGKSDIELGTDYSMELLMKHLSDRDKELILFLYKGYSQSKIASKLNISQSYASRLIEDLRKRCYDILGVDL